jgi:hypothetical protein
MKEGTMGSSADAVFETVTRMYEIGASKKCGCKRKIESTKHSREEYVEKMRDERLPKISV